MYLTFICLSMDETDSDSLLFTFALKKLYFQFFLQTISKYSLFLLFLLLNYEKSVHAHNYRSSGRDCVLIILFQLYS